MPEPIPDQPGNHGDADHGDYFEIGGFHERMLEVKRRDGAEVSPSASTCRHDPAAAIPDWGHHT
jgi:hypothetical protein